MITHFTVRQTTTEEKIARMPYLTSSMVEAITTCPKWGIIHNVQGRRFVTGYRQMALEAGSLMHEVFSVYNLAALAIQGFYDHAEFHGQALFKDRWNAIDFTSIVKSGKPEHTIFDKLAYRVIGSSDYYDDPEDRNRTIANLEHCAIELGAAFLRGPITWPILVADEKDPSLPVGIEQSLDVVFTITIEDGNEITQRFIGLVDVVYQNRETKQITIGEYKTTSSMNDGWRESFKTRHQQSFYRAAMKAYFDNVADDIILIGSTIPVRKTAQTVVDFPIYRSDEHTVNALTTLLTAKKFTEMYKDEKAVAAPMFTHSCNRYFRPCSLMDLCNASIEDQYVIREQMEVVPYPSPSEMKAMLRQGE